MLKLVKNFINNLSTGAEDGNVELYFRNTSNNELLVQKSVFFC